MKEIWQKINAEIKKLELKRHELHIQSKCITEQIDSLESYKFEIEVLMSKEGKEI